MLKKVFVSPPVKGQATAGVLWSAVKWLIFVSDPDPSLHNTLSRRDVGTEHTALVPGKSSPVINHGTRPWYQALCVMLDVIFILDVADVMLTGCPWRETDGIRLWPCRKYETLQPGKNNLT